MTNYNNTIHNYYIYYYNLKIGSSEYKNHTVLQPGEDLAHSGVHARMTQEITGSLLKV